MLRRSQHLKLVFKTVAKLNVPQASPQSFLIAKGGQATFNPLLQMTKL